MTEVDVEKTETGSSSNANPTGIQVAGTKLQNNDAGDATRAKENNSEGSAKPEVDNDKTDPKDAISKSDDKNEAVKRDEESKEEHSPKADDDQQRGRYRGRYNPGGRFGGRFRITPEEEQRRWDDQQKKKTVIQEGVSGKVKWYSFRKNYGFIQRDDDQKDVFVHQMAIAKSRIRKLHLRTLGHGETVQFDVVQGKKGLEASNVTGPNGTEVQGCRIIFIFNHNFDRRRPRSPYYNDFNRRPAYYNNYVRRPDVRDRDVRARDDWNGARYQGPRRPYEDNRDGSRRPYQDNREVSRRPYQNNRDPSGHRGEKFDRPPYQRRNVFRGRRRSSRTAEQQKEENVEAKEAIVADKKNEIKSNNNKNGSRRRGRQFRGRSFKNQKDKNEGAASAQSDALLVKDASSAKPAELVQKDKQCMPDDIVQGIQAIEVCS